MSDIKSAPLSDLVKEIIDNRGRTCPTSDQGIPLIATNCIKEDSIYPTHEKVRYVSDETYKEWFRGHPLPGDILFVNKGTPGRVCLAPDPIDFCIAQDMVSLRADNSVVSPLYLFAALRSPQVKASIDNMHVGTMIPHFKKGDFDKLLIPLPSRHDQECIGGIYYDFSLAIENKRKTNETLEAMAKALFKSWFVDFDPVRAKVESRPTGLPADISDMFPDSFEDSELGEIPSGWLVGTIASSVGVVFDGPHATPKEADEGNVFLGIKNMTGSSLDLSDVKLIGHDDWSQWTRRVEPRADDIVFTYEAALGLFAVIPDGLKCCLGRRMALVRTKATNGTPHFWFHQFIAKPFQKVIEERSIHGATVNRTPLTEFPGYPILEPPETLRLAFDHAASSLWARIHTASNQTASLTSLRDTLLPKLISGEIRIPDAEKLLEDVGV